MVNCVREVKGGCRCKCVCLVLGGEKRVGICVREVKGACMMQGSDGRGIRVYVKISKEGCGQV